MSSFYHYGTPQDEEDHSQWGRSEPTTPLPLSSQSDIALHRFERASAASTYADKYEPVAAGESTGLRSYPVGQIPRTSSQDSSWWAAKSTRFRRFFLAALIALVLLIAAAVAIPVALKETGDKSNKSSSSSTSPDGGDAQPTTTTSAHPGVPTGAAGADWQTAPYGGDGSIVYTEDGSHFVYNNTMGGFWNAIPFNDTAQAQADVPPLNEPWDYDSLKINGVNLGGWLIVEPFIVPGLFEPFNPSGNEVNFNATVIDEWTLSLALGDNLTTVIENHYKTFITEKDFAEIAGAGLNWIRLPIPYWIIETYEGEPFLAQVGWRYLLKALAWARKYGLRVNLDLHAVPGSQNGYNHSSKQGTVNFLAGVMGIANAQRTMNYIRTLAEFIAQPQYTNVVPMFSVINEPLAVAIGTDVLRSFYIDVYNMIRNVITALGEGKGPWITFHDGFVTQQGGITLASNVSAGGWGGFLTGADRMALDSHPYLCFSTPNNDGLPYQAAKPCSYWAGPFNASREEFGATMAGEWALAVNDCGLWLNNVGNGQRYDGTYYVPGNTTAPMFKGVGSCDDWNNYPAWNQSWKDGFKLVAQGHQSAFRDWFFWTWKTGYSTTMGKIANPLWNYQLGLENGYLPHDPRARPDACATFVAQQGVSMSANIAPTLSAWMTGGAGAGTILATDQVASWPWPPATVGAGKTPVSNLPTYTQTGAVSTMSAASPTSWPAGYSTSNNVGDGWAQATDTASWYTPVAGCSYLNPWSGNGAAVPTAACTGPAERMKRAPKPTAPPRSPRLA